MSNIELLTLIALIIIFCLVSNDDGYNSGLTEGRRQIVSGEWQCAKDINGTLQCKETDEGQ